MMVTGEKGHVSTINILLSKLFKAHATQGAVPLVGTSLFRSCNALAPI